LITCNAREQHLLSQLYVPSCSESQYLPIPPITFHHARSRIRHAASSMCCTQYCCTRLARTAYPRTLLGRREWAHRRHRSQHPGATRRKKCHRSPSSHRSAATDQYHCFCGRQSCPGQRHPVWHDDQAVQPAHRIGWQCCAARSRQGIQALKLGSLSATC